MDEELKIKKLQEIIEIQRDAQRFNPDSYDTGLLNGLLLAESIMLDIYSVEFAEIHNKDKSFEKSLEHIINLFSIDSKFNMSDKDLVVHIMNFLKALEGIDEDKLKEFYMEIML